MLNIRKWFIRKFRLFGIDTKPIQKNSEKHKPRGPWTIKLNEYIARNVWNFDISIQIGSVEKVQDFKLKLFELYCARSEKSPNERVRATEWEIETSALHTHHSVNLSLLNFRANLSMEPELRLKSGKGNNKI